MEDVKLKSNVALDDKKHWQNLFFNNFLYELNRADYKPEDIIKYVWKPFCPEELNISGENRDLSLFKVETVPAEIKRYLKRIDENLPENQIQAKDFFANQKLVFVLLPGFTHHTLKFPAFITQNKLARSPIDIAEFSQSADGKQTKEIFKHEGKKKGEDSGVKLVYVAYPRSNSSPRFILKPSFDILNQSESLKKWVFDEGYKIVFIGYSYGSVLALELLASMNCGEFKDTFILKNTLAFLSINGCLQGSYLADSVLSTKAKFNIQKFVNLAKNFPPIGLLMGLKNDHEGDDLLAGVEALTHIDRQARLKKYIDKVPEHIKYFSICCFLSEKDYENGIFKNFDDWVMYKQSLASKDVSIYNDGQMVLEDCFLPKFPNVDANKIIELGAVRAHHWAVSFSTFNFGQNKFPRLPYYKALAKTLAAGGIVNE